MNVIDNIKEIRKEKGISHDAMALNLGITQAAYSKIEKNETKLSVERLFKIAEILEVSVEKLLNLDSKSFHQNIHDNDQVTAISHQQVDNLYQDNHNLTQELLNAKNSLIEKQQEEINFLRNLLDK